MSLFKVNVTAVNPKREELTAPAVETIGPNPRRRASAALVRPWSPASGGGCSRR